jgi:leucyl aminopeptidase
MTLTFAPSDAHAVPLLAVAPEGLEAALLALPAPMAAWARAQGFKAGPGEALALPGEGGEVARALIGLGAPEARARHRFALAKGARLPAGTYRLEGLGGREAREAALGWLLEGYRFGRYKEAAPPGARLVAPEGLDAAAIERLARAEALTRDLVNTPASDMGPAELEAAARALAGRHGARLMVTAGPELAEAFPLIHAVGRAAAPGREPRLIDLAWGERGPSLVLVGKGVCFDTGGLDIKPAASMLLMKKDMGGAATVLGLAQAIMEGALPLRLRVLIPAVENAVGPASFRPGDVLRSRKGLTVEVNNTDAEGRLVLADALALAAEGPADLTASFATLTGAARVALGPDLAPFFTDDEALAAALSRGGAEWADPVWRLPFHDPYEALIEPGIADLDNAPGGGMAGAVTAALFLRRFAPARYLHLDIFAWTPTAAPGRSKGGVGQGARALLAALPEALGL